MSTALLEAIVALIGELPATSQAVVNLIEALRNDGTVTDEQLAQATVAFQTSVGKLQAKLNADLNA